MSLRLILGFLLLLAGPGYAAGEEGKLAGEDEAVTRPSAKPTMAEPDQGGPITLTRGAKAQAPSFELPEFVITGSGERKAVSSRPELSHWMDTSGGIKASPSEAEASKSQMAAQADRQTLGNQTETARPAYGQAWMLYGLANTLEGGAFYGREAGNSFFLLEGSHASTDGGPSPLKAYAINQSRSDLLSAHGGLKTAGGGQAGIELSGAWRDRLLTRVPLPAPRTERSRYLGGLSWDAGPGSAWRETLAFSAAQSQVLLPGQGTAYDESLLRLDGGAERELLSKQSRTLLQIHAYAAELSQNRGDRTMILAGGWLMARLKAWKGSTLGVGLSLDSISGGTEALLLLPRAEFEQRLGAWGIWAKYLPGLELPTLQGGLFDKDLALPSARAKVAKDSLNFSGGLNAALPGEASLELSASIRQNEDAILLDDPAGLGFWSTANLRSLRRSVVKLEQTAPFWGEFRQRLSLAWQGAELLDSPGLAATFAPAWTAGLGLDWARQPYSVGLRLDFVAEREGRLAGGDHLPAYADLRLRAAYALSQGLTCFAEGRNLLMATVQEFSGYAEPAPMAGMGAEFKF